MWCLEERGALLRSKHIPGYATHVTLCVLRVYADENANYIVEMTSQRDIESSVEEYLNNEEGAISCSVMWFHL